MLQDLVIISLKLASKQKNEQNSSRLKVKTQLFNRSCRFILGGNNYIKEPRSPQKDRFYVFYSEFFGGLPLIFLDGLEIPKGSHHSAVKV